MTATTKISTATTTARRRQERRRQAATTASTTTTTTATATTARHDDATHDGKYDDGKSDDGKSDDGKSDDGKHDDSHDDGKSDDGHDDEGDDDGQGCNGPIAPTVTVHKVVIGGPKVAADFQMTLSGDPVPQDTATDTLSNTPIEVAEVADPDYELTSVVCVDSDTDAPLAEPLVLGDGQNATCTLTNTFSAVSTITVVKDVTNAWGGTLQSPDFQLRIDGAGVSQNVAHEVAPGAHTIDELARPNYDQTGITCVDLADDATVGDGGAIDLAVGQNVKCTVSNADKAPTLTVIKHVNPDSVETAPPSAFQLQIDGSDVPQNVAQNEHKGSHTVSEVPVAGYRLVGIDCTDANGPVVYDVNTGGVTLALGQHVTCILTNEHDPIDLAITKTDDGQVKVAGGDPFDYTITVDNLGPRDAEVADNVMVTDQLPAGLEFVSFPDNCTAAGQTLTCSIDSADLEVADPPVILTVTVLAGPDADSGTYTNMAFVDTPGDPACVGDGCVPVCDQESNNVACAIHRRHPRRGPDDRQGRRCRQRSSGGYVPLQHHGGQQRSVVVPAEHDGDRRPSGVPQSGQCHRAGPVDLQRLRPDRVYLRRLAATWYLGSGHHRHGHPRCLVPR